MCPNLLEPNLQRLVISLKESLKISKYIMLPVFVYFSEMNPHNEL